MTSLQLNDLNVEVIQKKIKNVHLSVYPPEGRVRVSAPESMALDTIRVFVISKMAWIKKRQAKMREQERERPREMIDRESHFFNGQRYLLKVVEHTGPAKVVCKHKTLELHVQPTMRVEQLLNVLDTWYRKHLKKVVPALIAQYEKRMDVHVNEFGIKKMKTKWGTCNPQAGRIWLNLELAKKPPECLEYIVVHEMVHLLEPSHNERFVLLMDKFMPKWRFHKEELTRLPVRHEKWEY